MTMPLEGIRIIDFAHVQAGPACTQLLGFYGADVIKVERPGSGDVTRSQLRDIPGADALYFTMLNGNKRSLTLDTKTNEGKEVLAAMIMASVKGFSEGHSYEDLKVYENVAQCAGGAASTTGFWDGPPTVSAAALGDSNTGMHLAIGILTALMQREKTGKGQKVSCSMQDAVLNLCRVKLRDQQRLDKVGYLEEYPQYPHGTFSDVVPRGGNAGGGGQPGWVLKCKGWETDPNAYIYFTIQGHAWEPITKAIGKPEWANDPAYMTAQARQDKIFDIFTTIEEWLKDKTKFEAVDILREFDIPCAPVFSMKELAESPDLRKSGSIVEVDHKVRGKDLTIGSPIKFSDMDVAVKH